MTNACKTPEAVMQALITALAAGLAVWGAVQLLESFQSGGERQRAQALNLIKAGGELVRTLGGDTAIKTVSIGYMVRAPTFALPIPLRALPAQPPFLMRAAFFMHKNTNTKIQEPQSGRK